MIKHFCDRCGAELDMDKPVKTESGFSLNDKTELCEECAEDLARWIKEGRRES